jgi:predicted MFS family arabinose efflux permease
VLEPLSVSARVFRNANLRRLLLAQAGSLLGHWGFTVALGVWAYQEGGVGLVGVVAFLRVAPTAVAAPFTGMAADRFPRERVLLATDLMRAVLVAIMAVAVAADAPAIAVILPLTLAAALQSAFYPAKCALLPTLSTSPQELTAANVASSTVESLGMFAGPGLGALILLVTSPAAVFAVSAGMLLWSAAFVSRIVAAPSEAPTARPAATGLRAELGGGFRTIGADRRLGLMLMLLTLQTFVCGALNVFIVVVALDLLGHGDAWVGYLTAAFGIGGMLGGVVGATLVGVRRLTTPLLLGLVGWGAPLVVIGAFPEGPVALGALVVVGIANTVFDVAALTLLQRAIPDDVLARVFGISEMLVMSAIAVGGLVAPVLVDGLGAQEAIAICGALLPLTALLAWSGVRRIDAAAAAPERGLQLLGGVPIFAPLGTAALEQLAGKLAPYTVPMGARVFAQGDTGDRFYVIASGEVEIAADGRDVAHLTPGDCFGEIALLRDTPRTATARAVTECDLLSLEREDFVAAVTGHPQSAAAADGVIAARLGRSMTGLAPA